MFFSTARWQFVGLLLTVTAFSSLFAQTKPPIAPHDTLLRSAEAEEFRLIDPALKRVPYERLEEAHQQLKNRKSARLQAGILNVTWQERGPSNSGGRTRALLFDLNDPARKKVWAGSPAGGVWYTNDITDPNVGWTPISDTWENTIVTALAADPSNPQIMYAGTGDLIDLRSGGGIWKTTNGGSTWTRLSNTIPSGNAPAVSRAFEYIQRIVVNGSGHVFVATQFGVVKSIDGGNNWNYVLAPGQVIGIGGTPTNYFNDKVSDLEIGSDGILYAAFYPSRVFRANDVTATTWTEITPQGASGGERTELALAPSTSGAGQVVYGISRAYNPFNYGQDIRWFKRSTNGGATWSDMAIPVYFGNNYFTNGTGYYALNLCAHPNDPNTVYAGGYNWYRSTDGGTSWSGALNTYSYAQGCWFQPGSGLGAVFANEQGAQWSADWGNNSVERPTIDMRTDGYRAGEANSVAMRTSPGSAYLWASVRPLGLVQMQTAGLATGNNGIGSSLVTNADITFIDEDEPAIRIGTFYGTFYRFDGLTSNTLFTVNSYGLTIPADYDSQSNTLYVADYANNQYVIRRVTGIGSTLSSSFISIPTSNNLQSFVKLNKNRTALFVGGYPGKVYKITNLNQSSPTVVAIDNNAFPQFTSVSCIDVGADDNELLVTLSNFGVRSVWYTNNGGATWVSKDDTDYGLPDMPVRSALFNQQNRKQVLLGTELGVWSTTDITAANPGWTPTSTGIGTFRVNQLRYRASDGRMTAATHGRGIFTSDAFAIPYALPTVAITSISNTTLCAGSTFTVSFTKSGPAMGSANKYEVWLSDANGNFATMQRIGSSADSPITATVPSGYRAALPYGNNYRVKVIATDPEVQSDVSSALLIGDLNSVYITDRTGGSSPTVFPGSQVTLSIKASGYNSDSAPTERHQWQFNGANIAGATDASYPAVNPGIYSVLVTQAGCNQMSYSYTLYTSSVVNPFVSQSAPPVICQGQSTKLSATYPGDNATFQWARNGANIAGATSYTYSASETGLYTYRLQDGNNAAVSQGVYIQVGQSLPVSAQIGSLTDSVRCAAYSGSTAIYASYHPSYTYQWKLNGTPINGAISSSYSAYSPGAYSVTVKHGVCETTSNAVMLKSAASTIPVTINYTGSTSLCAGESRSLYASTVTNATYQWQKDGVDILGATSYGLSVNSTGNYSVKVTQSGCTGTSDVVRFQFGNSFVFKIDASYNPGTCSNYSLSSQDYFNILPGYTYQWQKDGVDLSNATDSFYFITTPGVYSLRITNGACTGVSKPYYAEMGTVTKPNLIVDGSTQRCAGGSIRLTTSAYTGTYQWKRNGIAIPFAQTNIYYATESGIYTLVNTHGPCQAESDPVAITIGEPTTAKIISNSLISAGQTTNLPVTFTGPAPWSFTLTNGQSVQNVAQNPYLLPVSPTATTTYGLASVVNSCHVGTTTGQAVVTVGSGNADVSLKMAVSNRTPKVNDVVDVAMTLTNAGPQNAVGVQVKSLLPTGLTFTESNSPNVSFEAGYVNAAIGTLMVGDVKTVNFRARATQAGTFATAAQVTNSQTPDPDSQPDSGTGDGQDDASTVDLRTADNNGPLIVSANPNQVPLPRVLSNQPIADAATADLSLTISADKQIANNTVKDSVGITVTVSNRGGTTANNVTVEVSIPNGYSSIGNSIKWVRLNNQTYRGYVNQLPAGSSAKLVFYWQPDATGSLKAQIVDAAETDPDSTLGNGYGKGEDDEAAVSVRVR